MTSPVRPPALTTRDVDRGNPAGTAPVVRLSGGVLIVDDDNGVRSVLADGLRRQGFVIWAAAGGREAVEVYRSYHGSIGMVLLDVRMPVQDGPETLAALRRFDPKVQACFVTGDAGRYSEQDLFDLGALAVFRKPPRLAEMGERLAVLMSPMKRAAPSI
jgi:two-component system cell cycle sensor histidine kinase/response regulator CckA